MKLVKYNFNLSVFFTLVHEYNKEMQVRQFTFTTNWKIFYNRFGFNLSAINYKMI